jgi:hypothetical protein
MRWLNQRQLGVYLYAIEHNFRATRRDVEITNDKLRWKLGACTPNTVVTRACGILARNPESGNSVHVICRSM